MVKYCIYCGEDYNKPHYDLCPINWNRTIPMPKMIWGYELKAGYNSVESNLCLGRHGIFLMISSRDGKVEMGPQNKVIGYRLAYELIAHNMKCHENKKEQLLSKVNSIFGFYYRKKLNNIDKIIESLEKMAQACNKKYGGPVLNIDKIINTGKNTFPIDLKNPNKICVPFYRDSETKDLFYEFIN